MLDTSTSHHVFDRCVVISNISYFSFLTLDEYIGMVVVKKGKSNVSLMGCGGAHFSCVGSHNVPLGEAESPACGYSW